MPHFGKATSLVHQPERRDDASVYGCRSCHSFCPRHGDRAHDPDGGAVIDHALDVIHKEAPFRVEVGARIRPRLRVGAELLDAGVHKVVMLQNPHPFDDPHFFAGVRRYSSSSRARLSAMYSASAICSTVGRRPHVRCGRVWPCVGDGRQCDGKWAIIAGTSMRKRVSLPRQARASGLASGTWGWKTIWTSPRRS
jgi:hypothetical protein